MRDRDSRGRPCNARPRDGLGRPLPRGSAGVARVPEDLRLTPAQALELAQVLLDQGRPFHAHEVLEGVWRSAPARERALWQGLAQLAVGLTHLLRGNRAGARAVLARGSRRVAPYAGDPPHDLDLRGILRWSEALVRLTRASGAVGGERELPPVPRLTRHAPGGTARSGPPPGTGRAEG